MIYKIEKDGYTISTGKATLDVNLIHTFLSKESYWSKGIPLSIVKKSIKCSICFGVYHNNKQIGFARVITDKATFAYLADVFIIEAFRGKGLAKWLMEYIMAHPDLQQLRSWMLGTRDAHSLYRQFGFNELENPNRFMRRGMFTEYLNNY